MPCGLSVCVLPALPEPRCSLYPVCASLTSLRHTSPHNHRPLYLIPVSVTLLHHSFLHNRRPLYLSRCLSELSHTFPEAAEWLVELAVSGGAPAPVGLGQAAALALLTAAFWSCPTLAAPCLRQIVPGGSGGGGGEQAGDGGGGGGGGRDDTVAWAALEAVMRDAAQVMKLRRLGEGLMVAQRGGGGTLEVLLERSGVSKVTHTFCIASAYLLQSFSGGSGILISDHESSPVPGILQLNFRLCPY